MNNDKALQAFPTNMDSIIEMTTTLKEKAENHFGYDPEEINYAHVGDLARIKELLKEAVRIAD